jgi:23S rRNA (adenine2503-C2)-methyltransferase
MNLEKLNRLLQGEPAYRQAQVYRALFHNLIDDWDQATALPKELRASLREQCPLAIPVETHSAPDGGAMKTVVTLSDGELVETVLLRHKDGRNTLCISSQAGCALRCAFCATGSQGFRRNLSATEIVSQAVCWGRILKKVGARPTNIVFMGMGEPLLNYDGMMTAIRILNDKGAFGIGARHISVSTVGIAPGIKRLSAEKLQLNLAVSLNAPDDTLRNTIMPVNRTYPLGVLLPAIATYIEKTNRRVMIEYVMLNGVNDSPRHAEKLAALLKKELGKLFFVNLIAHNPASSYRPSSPATARSFKQTLERHRIGVTQRYRFGKDIRGGCGQLAGKIVSDNGF